MITAREYGPGDAAAWTAFLAGSNNGTLFHDPAFLDYHPEGRFDFRHVVFSRDDRPVALLPGGVADGEEGPVYRSPLGASVGGLVVAPGAKAELAVELVDVLVAFARERALVGIDLTLAPPAYDARPSQVIEFALHGRGFRLAERWMPLLVALDPEENEPYRRLFGSRRASYVRANRERVDVRESGREALRDFLPLFEATYARHGSKPTHTAEEIDDLLARFPDRVRLWVARAEGTPIAAVLLLILNPQVCYSFYICDPGGHRELHGMTLLFAELIERLGQRGFRYLDLGPSASSQHFNTGVVRFKEGLGALGFCRDRWTLALGAER